MHLDTLAVSIHIEIGRNWTKLEHTTPEETMISFLAFSRYGVSTVSTATPDALLPSKMIFLAKVDLYIEKTVAPHAG